eukprot:8783235-Alexandrium_andersonii.AAC.1
MGRGSRRSRAQRGSGRPPYSLNGSAIRRGTSTWQGATRTEHASGHRCPECGSAGRACACI